MKEGRRRLFTKDDVILGGLGTLSLLSLVGLAYYGGWKTQTIQIETNKREFHTYFHQNPAMVALKQAAPDEYQKFYKLYEGSLLNVFELSRVRLHDLPRMLSSYLQNNLRTAAAASPDHHAAIAKAYYAVVQQAKRLGPAQCFNVLASQGNVNVYGDEGIKYLRIESEYSAAVIRAIQDGGKRPWVAWNSDMPYQSYDALIARMRANGASTAVVDYNLSNIPSDLSADQKCDAELMLSKSLAQMPTSQVTDYYRARFSAPPAYSQPRYDTYPAPDYPPVMTPPAMPGPPSQTQTPMPAPPPPNPRPGWKI